MLFESRTRKLPLPNKFYIDKSKTFQSPGRNVLHTQSLQNFYKHIPGLRKASSSPRYRSPTQNRLNESSSTVVLCPKCEKRSNETISQTYHQSPPKIRPSHHNIVCEDCSEGSFSKVFKVVCLNESEKYACGTQKIKIIESVGEIEEFSKFQVVGSGKSVQVHYQEVYPPPKQELTSLIPECKRENGVLGYSLKEEERKRVAIRRAEYANRVKGVAKTIITTIPADSDNFIKSEGRRHSNHENIYYENEENFNTQPNKISTLSSKKPCHLKKNSYQNSEEYQKDSLKASIEISKISVKHKIIAKLAGKNFSQLLDSGKPQNKNPENEKSRPKKPDLPINSEASIKSEESQRENRPEIANSPLNTIAESFKNNENNLDLDKNSAHSSSRNFEYQKQNEDILIKENKILYSETTEKNSIDFANIENPMSSRSESYKGKSPESYDMHFKSPDSPDIISKSQKNCKGSDKKIITPGSNREEIKFGSQEFFLCKDEESKNSEIQTPEKNISFEYREDEEESSENLEFSAEKIRLEDDVQENSDVLEKNLHENIDDEYYKTGLENPSKSLLFGLDQSKLLEVYIGSPKNNIEVYDLGLDKKKNSDTNIGRERLSSGILRKISESDEDRQATPDDLREDDQECNKILLDDDKCIKGNIEKEKFEEAEEKPSRAADGIDPEKINMLLLAFTDPQVIKGLKLLGGFADYLEQNGKDILDWKF
ncbi:hypothetical protein SteCoe_21553 [Stentor coeruleus]|uniref:Uncharacterized protein n=1 Tax=Stentor coeruleus TaxID=5963 RepID=A0A1R2BP69_9CILI|nr:hypothetical protein SteCoe_21553 [Stentor coeruleus]